MILFSDYQGKVLVNSFYYLPFSRNGNGNGIYIPHFYMYIFKCGLHLSHVQG